MRSGGAGRSPAPPHLPADDRLGNRASFRAAPPRHRTVPPSPRSTWAHDLAAGPVDARVLPGRPAAPARERLLDGRHLDRPGRSDLQPHELPDPVQHAGLPDHHAADRGDRRRRDGGRHRARPADRVLRRSAREPTDAIDPARRRGAAPLVQLPDPCVRVADDHVARRAPGMDVVEARPAGGGHRQLAVGHLAHVHLPVVAVRRSSPSMRRSNGSPSRTWRLRAISGGEGGQRCGT